MRTTCPTCGESHGYAIVSARDLEAAFDFSRPWGGLRLHCPGCGALQRISLRPLKLTNERPDGLPEGFRVHAVAGPGADILPFPPCCRGGEAPAG